LESSFGPAQAEVAVPVIHDGPKSSSGEAMSDVWGFRDLVPERAAHIQCLGFTERQARFLVTVMLHSGGVHRMPILPLRRHRTRAEDA
jgi:hypothetical protein